MLCVTRNWFHFEKLLFLCYCTSKQVYWNLGCNAHVDDVNAWDDFDDVDDDTIGEKVA